LGVEFGVEGKHDDVLHGCVLSSVEPFHPHSERTTPFSTALEKILGREMRGLVGVLTFRAKSDLPRRDPRGRRAEAPKRAVEGNTRITRAVGSSPFEAPFGAKTDNGLHQKQILQLRKVRSETSDRSQRAKVTWMTPLSATSDVTV
jgi:hypothetical protein